MRSIYVWDWGVRLFHWSLVIAFFSNDWLIDDDSDLHEYVGYFVVALLAFRLIWGFLGLKHARFSEFPISFEQCLGQIKDIALDRKHIHIGHTPLGSVMVYNLLVAIGMIGLSGYLMTTDMFWGMEWLEELHEGCVVWAEISIIVHIAAVIFESKRTKVNLPKAMLNGVKVLP